MPNITIEFVNKTNQPGEYLDDKLKGFRLRVGLSGVKTYLVRARIRGGLYIAYTIGRHGAPYNAATARKRAEEILDLTRKGIDPKDVDREVKAEQKRLEVKEERLRAANSLTLRALFLAWKADERKTKDSTKRLYEQVIFKHLADWLDFPVVEITPEMVAHRYDKVADVTIASANNAFRALRMLFNWEITRQEDSPTKFLASNPVSVLARRKRNKWRQLKPRSASIADVDLHAWFSSTQSLENAIYADFFTLLLVTGLRRDEAKKLEWRDIDFKKKTLTARNTKNGLDHVLPLTDFTYSLLKGREDSASQIKDPGIAANGCRFVFPGSGSKGFISDILHYQRKITKASGVDFTPHQLRRTFSYAAARARLSEAERKRLLNHILKSDVTDAHYSPWRINELREPLQSVEEFLLKLAKKKATEKVNIEVLPLKMA